MSTAAVIDRSAEPRRPMNENLNQVVVVSSLVLLVAGMTASAAYVPFTGNEPGTLYSYHLDGPGDDTANVVLTSGKTGGTALTDAFTVTPGANTPLKSELSLYGGCAYFEAPVANLPSKAYIVGDSGMPSTTSLYVDFLAKPYLATGYYQAGAMVSKDSAFAIYNNPDGSVWSYLGTGTAWDSATFIKSAAGVLKDMEWAHIQLQYNGSVVSLLVNDQVVGTKNWTGTIAGGSASLTLGNWAPTSTAEYYGGMLDEVWVGTAIPEPAMIGLLGLGLLGLIGRRNRG